MGLFDKLLQNKDLLKNVEALTGNKDLLGNLNLSGNKNVMGAIMALASNKDFTSKLAAAKDDKQVKDLINTATAALKDMKLSDEEKKELTEKVKALVAKN